MTETSEQLALMDHRRRVTFWASAATELVTFALHTGIWLIATLFVTAITWRGFALAMAVCFALAGACVIVGAVNVRRFHRRHRGGASDQGAGNGG